MITQQMIARINELARKQKCSSLTEQEKQEQSQLRRAYIDHIKQQVQQQLDRIEFTEDIDVDRKPRN